MEQNIETKIEKELLAAIEISQQRIRMLGRIRSRKKKNATEEELSWLKDNSVPPLSENIVALMLAAKTDKRKKKNNLYKPFLLMENSPAALTFRYKLEEMIAKKEPFHYDCIIKRSIFYDKNRKKLRKGHCTAVQFDFDGKELSIFYLDASEDRCNYDYAQSFTSLHPNAQFHAYTAGKIQYESTGCSIFSLQHLNTLSYKNIDEKKHLNTVSAQKLEPVFLKNIQSTSFLEKYPNQHHTINKKNNITLKAYIEKNSIYVEESNTYINQSHYITKFKLQNYAIAYKTHKYLQAALDKFKELQQDSTVNMAQFIADMSSCHDKNILSDTVDTGAQARMLRSYIQQGKIDAIRELVIFAMDTDNHIFYQELLNAGIGNSIPEIIDWLHNKRANLDECNVEGNNLLMASVYFGHIDVVKKLLELGVLTDIPRRDGRTPAVIAAQQGKLEVIEVMEKGGIDFSAPIGNGLTPIFIAAQYGQCHVIEFFLNHLSSPFVPFISTVENLINFSKSHDENVIKRMDAFIYSKSQNPLLSPRYSDKIEILPQEIAMIMGHQDVVSLFDAHTKTRTQRLPQKDNTYYSFLLACMAHKYTHRLLTTLIIIGVIAAILSLGALTGPVGWTALSLTAAGLLSTTPMVLGITGAGTVGVSAALRVGGLFAENKYKASLNEKISPDNDKDSEPLLSTK